MTGAGLVMTEGAQTKLTKRVVDAAVAKPVRYIVWDAELAGFGLRVEPSGLKTFVARYRAGSGRSGTLRQATIGRYGKLTTEEARALARRTLGAATAGGDPVGDRHASRRLGVTVAEVCDWYLEQAKTGRLLGRRGRAIKHSTLVTDRSRIESHVKPLLGKRAVRQLSPAELEEFQADIAVGRRAEGGRTNGRGADVAGGAGAAGRTLGMLKSIFEHAVRKGFIETNPARGARKLADQRRTVRLSLGQVRALGAAMRAACHEGENPTGLAAIRFILLTGFRKQEALGIRPTWIRPAGGVDLPDSKSGPQMRPVGKSALESLRKQADHGGAWVFPGDRGKGHFVGLPKVLARVCARAGLANVTAHTLRHSFASIAAELGYSEFTIAGLLGHAAGSVTASYVHLDSALVVAADRLSAILAAALDGRTAAEVVSIEKLGRSKLGA